MTEYLFTSRIIKASALIADTKALLAAWDLSQDPSANLERVRHENVLGKASRLRVSQVLSKLRQRYFDDPEVGSALVSLVQANVPSAWVDPLLYYYSVKNDLTLQGIVLDIVYPRMMNGRTNISVEDVVRQLRDWSDAGKTTSPWGEDTVRRVARNTMAALRDFGVLQGRSTKSITPIYLPIETFAFLAFELARNQKSGEQIVHSEDWKIFFLPIDSVERFFLEAHQERLLTYYAAGSIIRLEFPASNLTEFANVLIKRTR
ncbi:MAG: DUF1819 family protein [Anaerolineaceae bacterium]|nr:DUF1819 family protein [Anaerolineaceae bacterium]